MVAVLNLAIFDTETFPPTNWTKFAPSGGTGWDPIDVGREPYPGWITGAWNNPQQLGRKAAYVTYIHEGQK